MELLTFGYDSRSQLPAPSSDTTKPASILKARIINVLWSSWCDAVIAHVNDGDEWIVAYTGTGLTTNQRAYITESRAIKDALNDSGREINVFGSAMHHGLRGYVIPKADPEVASHQVVLFATDLEMEEGWPEVQDYVLNGEHEIANIKSMSGGHLLISAKACSTGEEKILKIESIAELRNYLASGTIPFSTLSTLASFIPVQWALNATTSTALDADGRVYTSTHDPRYPKCLGRPYEGTSSFETIPYLSETRITKIVSGGYMSAAVSSDGELFLWGHACPGSAGELEVLNDKVVLGQNGIGNDFKETIISVEGERDEFVKCLEVQIEGQGARVYDVAIGYGHVLIAVEVVQLDGTTKCTSFAAGDNSKGQLGVDANKGFAEAFEEVVSLRGRHVAQFGAAGWLSFVVMSEA